MEKSLTHSGEMCVSRDGSQYSFLTSVSLRTFENLTRPHRLCPKNTLFSPTSLSRVTYFGFRSHGTLIRPFYKTVPFFCHGQSHLFWLNPQEIMLSYWRDVRTLRVSLRLTREHTRSLSFLFEKTPASLTFPPGSGGVR